MLQHSFYYGISSLTMMVYFFFIIYHIICNCICIINIPFVHFFFHFSKQFFIYFRKIIYKV